MTDRELLERAAKAAGIDLSGEDWYWSDLAHCFRSVKALKKWSPLHDSDDAFRLQVRAGMEVYVDLGASVTRVSYGRSFRYVSVDHDGDPEAATRRAIVLAAAKSLGPDLPDDIEPDEGDGGFHGMGM